MFCSRSSQPRKNHLGLLCLDSIAGVVKWLMGPSAKMVVSYNAAKSAQWQVVNPIGRKRAGGRLHAADSLESLSKVV